MNIELIDGSFAYNTGNEIFSGLSFSLERGEILSVLGPNGCGKTTLLKCLTGILELDGGRLIVNGMEADSKDNQNSFFGYVPPADDGADIILGIPDGASGQIPFHGNLYPPLGKRL